MEILKNMLLWMISFLSLHYSSLAEQKQSTAGHFTLPTSQEPGPLFGFEFGQNIVDKGDIQLFFYPTYQKGPHSKSTELIPNFLYGIRDDLSLFVQLGYATQFKRGACSSSGVEDMFVQLEYAFWNQNTYISSNQATVIGNITIPTGSASKQPRIGFGVPTFYLATSASHTSPKWYTWINPGFVIVPCSKNSPSFLQFFYQFGAGRNIAYAEAKWILSFLLEFNGSFQTKSHLNDLFIGPSLWFSTQRCILQAGISLPLYQRPGLRSQKTSYALAFNFGWKFN